MEKAAAKQGMSRPASAGPSGRSTDGVQHGHAWQQITKLSQNKCSPKWSFGGRHGGEGARLGTPGPGTYVANSARNPRGYAFGSSQRDPVEGRRGEAPGPGYYAPATRPRSAAPTYGFSKGGRGSGGPVRTPGPGTYNPDITASRHAAPQYSSTPRRGSQGPSSRVPGPGTYEASHRPDGERTPAWGFGSENRISDLDSRFGPGPGTYNLNGNVNGPSYSMRSRQHVSHLNDTPGPGAHGGMITQFG